jgi:nucleotide-binding universal stress UspA family protein
MIAKKLKARITLLSAIKKRPQSSQSQQQKISNERMSYLNSVVADLALSGVDAEAVVEIGSIFEVSDTLIRKNGFGLVITATRGDSGEPNWLQGGLSHKLVEKIDKPVLLVQVDAQNNGVLPKINSILVALDGSTYSERALPYARLLAKAFDSHLTLLCVSAVPEAEDYRAPADVVLKIREKAEASMYRFLNGTARLLRKDGLKVDVRVTGSIPVHAILAVAGEKNVDLLMLTSQGRGGFNALLLGSVAEHVVQNTQCPVFMVPIQADSQEPGYL